ncbi:MAG: acyl-CoA dehydrogenase family protein [Pseudomonadota bacterium]
MRACAARRPCWVWAGPVQALVKRIGKDLMPATGLAAARLLVRNAAQIRDAGERADLQAGMAKIVATDVAVAAAGACFRIHGATVIPRVAKRNASLASSTTSGRRFRGRRICGRESREESALRTPECVSAASR